jgi:hypothetical protein
VFVKKKYLSAEEQNSKKYRSAAIKKCIWVGILGLLLKTRKQNKRIRHSGQSWHSPFCHFFKILI